MGQNFVTKVRDFTGHRGFSPGTPAFPPLQIIQDAANIVLKIEKIHFHVSFLIATSLPLHHVYVLYTVVFVVFM